MRGIALSMLGGVAVVVAGLTVATPLLAADDAASVIKARQDLMKKQSDHMKSINAILKNGGDLAAVVEHADALQGTSEKIVDLFPEGTGMEDGVGRTGAKPAIWEDWAGFQAAAERLHRESAKLAEVAKNGDKAAVAAQFAAVGKQGCGGCHTTFRQKLD